MSKYVIKNCPGFDKHNTQCLDTPTLPITEMILCQDCTDCVMKKIYEKVKQCQCSELMNGYFDIEECE